MMCESDEFKKWQWKRSREQLKQLIVATILHFTVHNSQRVKIPYLSFMSFLNYGKKMQKNLNLKTMKIKKRLCTVLQSITGKVL